MDAIRGLVVGFAYAGLLAGCSTAPTSSDLRAQATLSAAQSQIAAGRAREIDAQATAHAAQIATAWARATEAARPTPTPTPQPTATISPTAIPTALPATSTVEPTIAPSATPQPTATDMPTATPQPMGTALHAAQSEQIDGEDRLANIGLMVFAAFLVAISAGALMRMVPRWRK